MARQSPVYYIAPSAINIIPNANSEASDLAVFVQDGTTITAYAPRAGINTENEAYRQWTLSGRNRRLSDDTKPYTIYARLPRQGTGAYITFAPKIWSELRQSWLDKYAYITPDGLAADTAPDVTDENNWYARLGDVSLPNGEQQRTVMLDTGILGTAEYNAEWNISPDALPLRLELQCMIDGEAPDAKDPAGATPYLYWGQVATLTALLTEGWTGTDIQRFDHWEIIRNTNNVAADTSWNAAHNIASQDLWRTGVINLQHRRGTGEADDFDGTVSAVFTVNAMQLNPEWEEGSSEPQYLVLKSASINIMAETVEKYEVVATTAVMAYNPMAGTYTPDGGILLRVRATTQKGETSQISFNQFNSAGLTCQYAADGVSTWTTFTTPAGARTWFATVPVGAFSNGKSVNVRITRDGTELHRTTIAYVRDGEDSKEREWIFLRATEPITFGPPEHPYPAWINIGEVNPAGEADGNDNNKDQDGWVPNGWWDEPQGVDATNRYEYGAYRDFVHESNGVTAHWGAFSAPTIWTHYGKDGKDGENAVRIDLDNEYDSLQYQGDGTTKVSPSGTVQSTASLFDGADDKSGDAVFVISNRSGMSDQQATISGRTVTVNGLISDGEVTVRAEYPVNSGKYYYAKFTVKKLIGTDKYDLVVAPNAVPVNTSNTVADTAINVQVYRTPANGGTRHLVEFTNKTTNDYGLTLSVKDSLNNNLTETTGTGTVTTRTFNLTGTMATNADNVMVVLTKDSKTQDAETVPITHVHNGIDGTGANAVRLDLDNEMDVLPADADGNTLQEVTLTTTVRLFDGSTAVSLDTSDVKSVSPLVIGGQPYGAVKSGTGGVTMTWTVPSGVTVDIDKAVLTIVVIKDSKQYTAKFIVAALKSGQPGVSPTVFRLLPSPSLISFKRDSSGDIPSSTQALSLSVKKSDGGGTSVISVESSGLNVRYRTDRAPSSASDGDVWPSAGLSVNSSVTYGSIYLAAFDSNGALVDRETVPVVKDGVNGANGEDAWGFVANPANVIITQSMDSGDSGTFSTAAVSFSAKKGNTAATITSVALTESSTFNCTKSGNVVTVISPKKDAQQNYYTNGSFTVTVTAQVTEGGITTTTTQVLTVLCYANLLGSWKTQVEGDVEQSIATKKFYFKDENGSIVAHETIGDYIKSSTENISTLTTSAAGGSNLLLGSEKYTADNKLDHKSSAADGAIEYNGLGNRPHIYTPIQLEAGVIYTLQVKSDGTLASGHQVVAENQGKYTAWLRINGTKDGVPYNGICFSTGNLTGTRSDGALYWTFTCALSGEYWFRTNTYSPNLTEVEVHVWDIMLQQGAIASDWVAPSRGTMSQIKQTADEIEAKVNETGVDITNGKVDLYADKVRFFKNKAAATAGDTAKIWIDGGDGSLHAVDVHLSGFLRKAKTVITTSNIEQYKRDDITSATVLDFDKCGSFIELSTGTAGYLTLPLMSNYLVQHYTQEQIDWIRTFVGAKILIYNQSGQILTLDLKTDSNGNTTSETLGNGRCMELECCLARDTVDNKEIICWEVISDAVALVKT